MWFPNVSTTFLYREASLEMLEFLSLYIGGIVIFIWDDQYIHYTTANKANQIVILIIHFCIFKQLIQLLKSYLKFESLLNKISYIGMSFCRRWGMKSCFYKFCPLIFTIAIYTVFLSMSHCMNSQFDFKCFSEYWNICSVCAEPRKIQAIFQFCKITWC